MSDMRWWVSVRLDSLVFVRREAGLGHMLVFDASVHHGKIADVLGSRTFLEENLLQSSAHCQRWFRVMCEDDK